LAVRAHDHRGLDGDLQAEGDDRRTRVLAGAQRKMAGVRLSWLARNGRSPGEESLTPAIAGQVIEAKPSFGQITPSEAALLVVRQLAKDQTWRISPNPDKKPGSLGGQKETPACR